MAELLLNTKKRGPDPAFQDGDTVHAMNDLRIHLIHAEHICRSGNLNKRWKRWIDPPLAEAYLAKRYQYRTERLSKTEARVTDQWALTSRIKSDVPNIYGNVMYVDQFFNRRLAAVPHLVFGSRGAEVFYHGGSRYLAKEDKDIWIEIEARTKFRKVDFGKHPWGDRDMKDHFVITVDDFDNTEREKLESSVWDKTVTPWKLLKARLNMVAWKTLPGLTPQIISDVTTDLKNVDIRDSYSWLKSSVVVVKP